MEEQVRSSSASSFKTRHYFGSCADDASYLLFLSERHFVFLPLKLQENDDRGF